MTQPIKYSKHKNSKRVALTIVIVWVVSAAIGSPIMLGLNTSPQRVPHLCIFYNSDFILYSSLSSFYIPCIVMVFLYYKIFKVIHDRARKAVAKKEARLRGIVIENAAQAQRLHQDAAALPQGDKNGNKSLQVGALDLFNGTPKIGCRFRTPHPALFLGENFFCARFYGSGWYLAVNKVWSVFLCKYFKNVI